MTAFKTSRHIEQDSGTFRMSIRHQVGWEPLRQLECSVKPLAKGYRLNVTLDEHGRTQIPVGGRFDHHHEASTKIVNGQTVDEKSDFPDRTVEHEFDLCRTAYAQAVEGMLEVLETEGATTTQKGDKNTRVHISFFSKKDDGTIDIQLLSPEAAADVKYSFTVDKKGAIKATEKTNKFDGFSRNLLPLSPDHDSVAYAFQSGVAAAQEIHAHHQAHGAQKDWTNRVGNQAKSAAPTR